MFISLGGNICLLLIVLLLLFVFICWNLNFIAAVYDMNCCHITIFIYIGYIANKILASKLEIEREIEYSTVQYIDWVVLPYTCTLCAQGIDVLQSEHV